MIDRELLEGTSRMKLDVLSGMHFSSRSLEVGNSDCYQELLLSVVFRLILSVALTTVH